MVYSTRYYELRALYLLIAHIAVTVAAVYCFTTLYSICASIMYYDSSLLM
jgi:hypothetical protein